MSCGHASCSCLVEPDAKYCSDHCRESWEQRGDLNERCGCGHADCLAERGVRSRDERLMESPERPLPDA